MPAFEDPPPNAGDVGLVFDWALRLAWGVGLYLRRVLGLQGTTPERNTELVRAFELGLLGPHPPAEAQ